MAKKTTVDKLQKVKPPARTKVLSLRVNAEEFDAVADVIKYNGFKNQGEVLRYWLDSFLSQQVEVSRKRLKNAEAAAKRKATRDAKKAAAHDDAK